MELHSCMLSLFAVVIQTSVILMAVGYHACLLATIFDNVRHISFVNGVHNVHISKHPECQPSGVFCIR